MSCAAVL